MKQKKNKLVGPLSCRAHAIEQRTQQPTFMAIPMLLIGSPWKEPTGNARRNLDRSLKYEMTIR
jgi:hypothetical protein